MRNGQGVGIGAVLTTLLTLVAAPTSAVEPEAGIDPVLFESAQRFRQVFGLEHDPEFVEATFTDARWSSSDWGVPLSSSEVADLWVRLVARDAIEPVIAKASGSNYYAGAMIAQDRGGVPVIFTTDSDALAEDLGAAANSASFEVQVVRNSRSQLRELQSRIIAALPELEKAGLEVVSIGLDVPANKVGIGVTGLSSQEERLLLARFGPEILAREDAASENDACTDMEHCGPQKGGIKTYQTGYPNSRTCTTGFMARRTDDAKLVMLTAGHCLALHDIPGADTWAHNGNTWGTELYNTWFDWSYADIGAIQLDADAVAALGSVTLSHWQDDPVVQNYNVATGWPSSSQITGDPVCRMGWGWFNEYGNGKKCGAVGANVEVARKSCQSGLNNNCRWINPVWEVTFDSLPGDSGGPVTRLLPTTPLTLSAYGTHVHSGSGTGAVGWYSPWQWSKIAYENLSLGHSITFCFTSTNPPCEP